MHTPVQKDKRHVIKLPPVDVGKLKRGHVAHRGGSGTHEDRRTNRLRTRAAQHRAALSDG